MKRGLLTFAAILMAVTLYAKDIRELVVTTQPPMSCQNCENKIKGNLRFEKGVKKIQTDIADQRVTIEYDAEKTTPEKIEEAFQKIGYNVAPINTSGSATPDCEAPQSCESSEDSVSSQDGQGGCCQ